MDVEASFKEYLEGISAALDGKEIDSVEVLKCKSVFDHPYTNRWTLRLDFLTVYFGLRSGEKCVSVEWKFTTDCVVEDQKIGEFLITMNKKLNTLPGFYDRGKAHGEEFYALLKKYKSPIYHEIVDAMTLKGWRRKKKIKISNDYVQGEEFLQYAEEEKVTLGNMFLSRNWVNLEVIYYPSHRPGDEFYAATTPTNLKRFSEN